MVTTEQAFEKALARAKTEGVRVYRQGDGTYTATSTSQPGRVYKVNGSCECQAGQNDRLCKHLAAVRAARLRAGEVRKCYHCGHIGDDVVASRRDYGILYWCADAIACGQRYDAKREVI